MGRPPALDERQKAEILRRLALGEKPSDLRREYRLTETTFRRHFSAGVSKVREVGEALASAEMALASLPVSAQVSARSMADQLKGLSSSLLNTASINGRTAERLSELAQKQVDALDLGADMTSEQVLKAGDRLNLAGGLLVMSNRATTLGTKLLVGNEGASEGGTVIVETGVPHG